MPLKTHIKHLVFWLVAFFAVQAVSGQDTTSYIPLSVKPTTDFDQRFYYTPGEVQNVWGYRIGVLINDKYKTGIGGYYMNKSTTRIISITDLSRTTADAFTVNKKLYLGTVYFEPYLMRRNLWETSIVFETGYGRTVNSISYQKNTLPSQSSNALIIPAGAGLSVNLKMPALFHFECFRWIGINAMGGYRISIYQEDKQYNYNGAYWSLSGAIFLDRMVEDFHSWKKEKAIAKGRKIIELSY